MGDVKLLDCTLRDGGYYTNWEFDDQLVKDYLGGMNKAKVERVEVGFRSYGSHVELWDDPGEYAFSSEHSRLLIDHADMPGTELGVMINAKEVLSHPCGLDSYMSAVFKNDVVDSILYFVRVATQIHDIGACRPICEKLAERGYQVILNVMQCDNLTPNSGAIIGFDVQQFKCIDTLYFADSLGCMMPEEVGSLISSAKRGWPGEIGFHAHDNLQEAVWNCRAAIDAGARWVDGTVCGMGRGAGNASTAALAMLLGKETFAIRDLAVKHFLPLQRAHGWGYHEFYERAAEWRIHPSYVQEMLKLGVEEKVAEKVLEGLRVEGRHYSEARLNEALKDRSSV